MLDLTDLVETPLGGAGGAFIHSILEGETGLAGALSRLDFSKGRSFAYLPRGMAPDQVMAFETVYSIGMDSSRDLLAHRYFLRREPITLVTHDQWMTGADFDNRRLEAFELRTAKERYFILHGRTMTRENLDTAFALVTFTFVGAAVRLPGETVRNLLAHDDPEELDVIVNSTNDVFINAYDQESFVVWTH